jgi:hypothetical protein
MIDPDALIAQEAETDALAAEERRMLAERDYRMVRDAAYEHGFDDEELGRSPYDE